MIKIPFNRDSFADEAKPKMSGVNATLEYDNLESALYKSATEIEKIIGRETYKKIVGQADSDRDDALDYLQRAMLHMAVNLQMIFLIVRIGNDGVTVKKNDDETTIYKYQQDLLQNSLINDTWYWMDRLIAHLNDHQAEYPKWVNPDSSDDIPVVFADYEKWLGIDNYFFVAKTRWILREVYLDTILPKISGKDLSAEQKDKTIRAVLYRFMYLVCIRMPYDMLPEPVRKDIDNEQSKSNKGSAETLIRERVSLQFNDQAKRYLSELDLSLRPKRLETVTERKIIYPDNRPNENEKFVVS